MIILKRIIEKLFFKKRNVLLNDRNCNNRNLFKLEENFEFRILFKEKDLIENTQYCNSKIIRKKINNYKKRLSKRCWILFFVFDEIQKQIVGYYWATFTQGKKKWFDNFLINKNEVLLCNAFVLKDYRSQGIYKYLIYKANNYFIDKQIFTVVEFSNTASLKANISAGLSKKSVNYLIKFFGLNILSIYIENKKVEIYTGRLLGNITIYKKK